MTGCPDCPHLRAEVNRLTAALAVEVSRRTLGGTPTAPDQEWANIGLPAPESATTGPGAQTGMSPSTDPRHWSADG